MKTCRKWVAALFAIILTVSSCVVVAEEALPTQWDLTEIYENVDAWQADYDRAMEILPQYESYQGTLNTVQGIYDYLQFAYMGELTRLETRLYLYAYLGYTLNPADSTFSALLAKITALQSEEARYAAVLQSELYSLPLETRQEFFADPLLEPFTYAFRSIVDPEYEPLSEETNTVLAILSPAMGRAENVFNILDSIEVPDPMITMPDGTEVALTDELYNQIIYEASVAIGETRREMSTRFEQTDAAIALKADQTEVNSLSTRVQSAEQKITPQAITAAVAASALYAFDKYEGRNYCLNSDGPFRFTGNRYYNEDGSPAYLVQKTLSLSEDLFPHSNGGTAIRVSLDIQRQDVDASQAATPGIYSGLWVYYRYLDAGVQKTSGLGWYLRTTDASFVATDEDWVRLRYGPLNLSSYSPVEIAYFALGTTSANGTTGTVRFRNVKLEVMSNWTDWSAAPEDIYGLAGRMTDAESRITQNANNISLKVNTSTYDFEKVYRSRTAPTEQYVDMLWLDMSLTPPILKRYTGSAWVAVGAQELRTSGISIGANNVAITTENFLLQLLDPADNENVLMEMSASGDVGFRALYADEVVSPSVVNAYTGPATLYVYPALSGMAANACRSLREALSRINGKALRYDVTVTFFTSAAETLYEMEGVEISGVTGPHTLRIEGMDRNKTLSTFLTVSSCTALIELSYLNIRDCRGLVGGTSKNSYLINARNNTFLSLTGCVLDLNNVTANAVQATASCVDLRYCEIRSAYIGLGLESATGNLYYCKGQCTFSVFCMAGIAFCTGTAPSGGRTASCNGQIFDAGVTIDAGAAVAPQTPDSTTVQYATLTKSYRGGWRSDTVDVVQGVYSDYGYSSGLSWNYGCMWFGNLRSVLSGTTIKSATLTLYRKTGSGSSAAKTLYLCAITNAAASGVPSIAANYTTREAMRNNESVVHYRWFLESGRLPLKFPNRRCFPIRTNPVDRG